MSRLGQLGVVLAFLLCGAGALAQGGANRLELFLRDHRFEPAELHVPANTAFGITVKNEDPTAEEFESGAMGVEKVIPGGRSLQIRVRPLAPGRYEFEGEYHNATAKGVIIVDPAR